MLRSSIHVPLQNDAVQVLRIVWRAGKNASKRHAIIGAGKAIDDGAGALLHSFIPHSFVTCFLAAWNGAGDGNYGADQSPADLFTATALRFPKPLRLGPFLILSVFFFADCLADCLCNTFHIVREICSQCSHYFLICPQISLSLFSLFS